MLQRTRPHLIGVIDETTPFVGGGVCYGVVSGVALADETDVRAAMMAVIPTDRRRPFHWSYEGPVARARMMEALDELPVLGRAFVVSCARRDQETARSVALAETLHELVVVDRCDEIIIEARTPAQDGRDKAQVLDVLKECAPQPLTYSWRRKSDELLWIADAIGGVIHDHLIGVEGGWFDLLTTATGLKIEYRTLHSSPKPPRKRRQSRLPS